MSISLDSTIGAKYEVQEEVHFIHLEEQKRKACLVFPDLNSIMLTM